jgi:hydrogenase nickel incorporation protein HypA/HybF
VDELALCQQIAEIAQERAAGRPVLRIHVQVGQLRDVDPETMLQCWPIVSQNPPLQGSVLDVESVPPGLVCRSCLQSSTVPPPVQRCPVCGAKEIRVVAGEQLVMTTLELAGTLDPVTG